MYLMEEVYYLWTFFNVAQPSWCPFVPFLVKELYGAGMGSRDGGVDAVPPLDHLWASLAPDSSDFVTQASMSRSSRLRAYWLVMPMMADS
jgi:hypothetical protein